MLVTTHAGWEMVGELCSGLEADGTGLVWECPLLVELPPLPGTPAAAAAVATAASTLAGQRASAKVDGPGPSRTASTIITPSSDGSTSVARAGGSVGPGQWVGASGSLAAGKQQRLRRSAFFCISPDACTNPTLYYLGEWVPAHEIRAMAAGSDQAENAGQGKDSPVSGPLQAKHDGVGPGTDDLCHAALTEQPMTQQQCNGSSTSNSSASEISLAGISNLAGTSAQAAGAKGGASSRSSDKSSSSKTTTSSSSSFTWSSTVDSARRDLLAASTRPTGPAIPDCPSCSDCPESDSGPELELNDHEEGPAALQRPAKEKGQGSAQSLVEDDSECCQQGQHDKGAHKQQQPQWERRQARLRAARCPKFLIKDALGPFKFDLGDILYAPNTLVDTPNVSAHG